MSNKRESGDERRRGGGARAATVRLKTAKGRTISSQRWLQRQLNDPYVHEAKRLGFRSRSAFKLEQLDERFKFLKTDQRVVDLGAAPGGWTQVVASRVLGKSGGGRVVGLDILEMEPLAGAEILCADFMTDEGLAELTSLLGGPADLVLSDMAAPTTGHAPTDHLRTTALCEAAYDFAETVLSPGGVFVAKVFKGGSEADLLRRMKLAFSTVRHAKPAASRPESPETYVVAMGFRGAGGPIQRR